MPIYEYACDKCDKVIELMQKMSDPPLKRCPECRGKVEKIMSQTSFQLKGAGWYASDYAKSGGSKAAKTESSDKAAADSSGSAAGACAKPECATTGCASKN